MNFAHFHQRDDLSAATCQSDSHTPKLSRHGLFISEAKAGNRDQRWPAARAGCATARFRDVIASGKSSGGSGGDSLGLPAPMMPQTTTHSSSLTHRAGHPITQTALSATNGWQSSNHTSGGANTYCFGLGIGKGMGTPVYRPLMGAPHDTRAPPSISSRVNGGEMVNRTQWVTCSGDACYSERREDRRGHFPGQGCGPPVRSRTPFADSFPLFPLKRWQTIRSSTIRTPRQRPWLAAVRWSA
jgi:hypothetical protein